MSEFSLHSFHTVICCVVVVREWSLNVRLNLEEVLNALHAHHEASYPGQVVKCYFLLILTDIDLDPHLLTACRMDIPKFCRDKKPEQGEVIPCLKKALDKRV